MAKRSTMVLDEDDEEEEQTCQCSCWTREEEILRTTTSEPTEAQIHFRGRLCKISTMFNAIYKHLERKSEENEVDHIETAKTNFMAQSNGRKFLLEHAWRILKNHSKWDASKPLDTDDHTKIFKPDVRPRPALKTRPAKKTKSETTGSSGGSASGSISDSLSEDLRRKLQAGSSEYEAKKEKELAYTECKELEFLMIDPDSLPEPRATIIRRKQEKIMAKYNQ
ncbi:hypothetical protein Tco_0939219 [Tanacetum coccineum]|uniref:No apical meristem-associated C-terminal domain-containing protein n=1 Tax=Tanacetum coccineum TaxID=301880 RepID=A0ABQ5DRA6_9ASTR